MAQDTPAQPKAPVPPPAKLRGWIKALLFVSLALNLAVAGLVIGAVVTHRGPDGRVPRLDRAVGPLTEALQRQDRRAIALALREAYRGKGNERAALKTEQDVMIGALRQVPFDPDTLKASLERQAKLTGARQEMGQTLLIERLAGMSDAERFAFAERLTQALARGEGYREKRRKDRARE